MDLLIQNGVIVTPEGRYPADIAVQDGKIAALLRGGAEGWSRKAARVIDARGLCILPGCIDPHVHFRDPGHTYKEDFTSGTRAAAAGGITTVYDMPNNLPRIVGIPELEGKKAAVTGRAAVDYALYGLLTKDSLPNLPDMVADGVRGFKCLMGVSVMRTPTGRDVDVWRALQILKDTGCPISIHAEDTEICEAERERLRQACRTDPLAHLESHPVISETLAVQRMIMLAEETGGRIHIAHLSAAGSVGLIRAAKARGVRITCETGPHNLFFTDEDYARLGRTLFMNPPVRSHADQEALFQGIRDGTIDMIATDHSPHTEQEKREGESPLSSLAGFCGVETSVPVMLTLVSRGKLTLEQYARLSSENPAKLFQLYPRKGCIQVGSDADLTLVDPNLERTLHREALHSKNKITPFDGVRLRGFPVYTIVRGRTVMEHGELADTLEGVFLG